MNDMHLLFINIQIKHIITPMSKKQKYAFRQLPPPQLSKIFSINQPANELIFQHWKNLISIMECSSDEKSKLMCLAYKDNSMIAIVCFQEGCFSFQRKFKILYGQMLDITCIKMHSINIKYEGTSFMRQVRRREKLLLELGLSMVLQSCII